MYSAEKKIDLGVFYVQIPWLNVTTEYLHRWLIRLYTSNFSFFCEVARFLHAFFPFKPSPEFPACVIILSHLYKGHKYLVFRNGPEDRLDKRGHLSSRSHCVFPLSPIFCRRTVEFNISDMLDDDIVYLGTRINASTPPARSAQRPVTGERLPISQTQT